MLRQLSFIVSSQSLYKIGSGLFIVKKHKIPDDMLLNDVKEYPDDYQYERAYRLNCSKTGIHYALKRLCISQKKDLGKSKSVPDKRVIYISKLDSFMQQGYPFDYIHENGFERETILPHAYASNR